MRREVGHDPLEQGALRPARAPEVERRGREVVDGLDADLGGDRLEAGDPDAGLLVALGGLGLVLAGERVEASRCRRPRATAVAVVGLVVEHDDVALVAQRAQHPAHHLVGRLGEHAWLLAGERLGELRRLDLLPQLEGVEVGDDDLRSAEVVDAVRWHEVALAVVVLRVRRQQHPQAVPDGDPRRDDQEGVSEAAVLRVGRLVEGVPGDEHRHDHGLAGAGGHLVGHAEQAGVGVLGHVPQLVLDPRIALLARHLGEVDRRLERLDLAEEQRPFAFGVRPVLEERSRRRRDPGPAAARATG